MKNTIRATRNNVIKSPPVKPFAGYKASKSGHAAFRGKITLESVRIGEAIGLSDQQIKALALLSEWEGQTPTKYCKSTVLGYLQASFDDLQELTKADDRPKEIAWAQKFLPLVAPLFPSVSAGKIPADVAGCSPAQSEDKAPRLTSEPDLFNAIRQSKALNELLLCTLDHSSASIFRMENGYLAAGVQSLMSDTEEKLDAAYEASRGSNS